MLFYRHASCLFSWKQYCIFYSLQLSHNNMQSRSGLFVLIDFLVLKSLLCSIIHWTIHKTHQAQLLGSCCDVQVWARICMLKRFLGSVGVSVVNGAINFHTIICNWNVGFIGIHQCPIFACTESHLVIKNVYLHWNFFVCFIFFLLL